jgi:protocatechuate 3,4-dioxygenase beta subunit
MADLRRPGADGEPLQLDGRVFDTNGVLLAGARVELWHADPAGRYGAATHRASRVTDARGRFGVRSVLPGHRAADRARHVHFVVTHPGHRSLVTRIYFRGDRNFAYALDPRLGIVLEQGDDDGVAWLYGRVEFVLEPAP